ncbi:MAG TPA: GNAT family N-acetyltransferase [Ilumatobacteraceae bacterium]|nr:GNAT family N-acetyltransferase [Ilumatobacteraceae bacterium]
MFTFRRLTREDFPLLGTWLAAPHVREWWNHDHSPEAVEDDFGAAVDGAEAGEDWLAELDGKPIGLIQYCRFVDYPDYAAEMEPVYPVDAAAASIDYLIGDVEMIGRSVGSAMIHAFVAFVWAHDPTTTHLVVPVNSANERSWRALLRAGFHLVARGEIDPDKPTHDRMHEVLRIDRPVAAS